MVKRLEESKVKQELIDQMHRLSYDLGQMGKDIHIATILSGGLIQLEHVHNIENQPMHFADTLLFDKVRNRLAPFKRLSFYLKIQGVLYKTSIFKSMIASNQVIEQVALIVTIIVIVFLLAVYFLYRYFLGRIWSDFFETINKIQNFDINSPEKLIFPDSMIIEFNALNDVLKKMINKINNDFKGLKEFSGNLTHEIQTPLAVIKSKADLLLQDQYANKDQLALAQEISKETSRISGLIKTLTLFTKLDHHQFPNKETIELERLIESKLEIFEDFIEGKNISIYKEVKKVPQINMNPELADILLTNLIKNAIKHNISNGNINISIDTNCIEIKNTGNKLKFDPNILFGRFSKASQKGESLGVGLSIAKKICDYYGFKISYNFIGQIHKITLEFTPNLLIEN
jgi:signal transduction histidine kinase